MQASYSIEESSHLYDLDYIYSYNNRLDDLYLSEKDKKKLDKYDSNYFKTNSLILFRFYRNKSTESKPEVIKVEVVDDEINVLLGIRGFIINNHTRFELDSVDVPSLPLRI